MRWPTSPWHPQASHAGGGDFFEGWYYKLVSAAGNSRWAIIPGISMGATSHAFVQFLDGATGQTHYYRYPLSDFRASRRWLDVRIGESRFTESGVTLDLEDDALRVTGKVSFDAWTPWPIRPWSPGAMGPFGLVPGMQCYHGVLSFDHCLQGSMEINGRSVSLDGGRGYTEKDWGRSFPAAWIWMQSNHWSRAHRSFMLSLARIPWLGRAFLGVVVGCWESERLVRIATYTGARLRHVAIRNDHVALRIDEPRPFGRGYRLEVDAQLGRRGALRGPVDGAMSMRVPESLDGEICLRLIRMRKGREEVLWNDRGRYAGIEVGGCPDLLYYP